MKILQMSGFVHLGTAIGPRAVLGSQQPRMSGTVEVFSVPPARSHALRGGDGSRSGGSVPPGASVSSLGRALPAFGCLALAALLIHSAVLAAEEATWKFGAAQAKITPQKLFWMGG